MESDAKRGVGSDENDGEELSPMLTITSLNRGMDSIVAKAGTLSTLDNIKGITSFERKFKRAIDTTPFGCYPSMLLDVYEGTVGWSETDMRFVEKGWRRVQEQKASTRTSSSVLLALTGDPDKLYESKKEQKIDPKALVPTVKELLGYREQVLALIDLLGKVIQRCVPDAQAQRLDAVLSMDCPVWAAVGGQVPPWRMVLPVAAASRPQLY